MGEGGRRRGAKELMREKPIVLCPRDGLSYAHPRSMFPCLLDADADAVTPIPGDGFGADMLECGLSEAVNSGFLVGELELVAECTALHHLKIPCRVSVLDRMQYHPMGEAEVAALAQGVERFVLRPDRKGVSQSALPDQRYEALINLQGEPI